MKIACAVRLPSGFCIVVGDGKSCVDVTLRGAWKPVVFNLPSLKAAFRVAHGLSPDAEITATLLAAMDPRAGIDFDEWYGEMPAIATADELLDWATDCDIREALMDILGMGYIPAEA